MDVSSSKSGTTPKSLEAELSRLTHDLMGGISSLLMCEHIITKELEACSEAQANEALQTTMSLMRDTAAQIRGFADQLMDISHDFQRRAKS